MVLSPAPKSTLLDLLRDILVYVSGVLELFMVKVSEENVKTLVLAGAVMAGRGVTTCVSDGTLEP